MSSFCLLVANKMSIWSVLSLLGCLLPILVLIGAKIMLHIKQGFLSWFLLLGFAAWWQSPVCTENRSLIAPSSTTGGITGPEGGPGPTPPFVLSIALLLEHCWLKYQPVLI